MRWLWLLVASAQLVLLLLTRYKANAIALTPPPLGRSYIIMHVRYVCRIKSKCLRRVFLQHKAFG